MINSLYKKLLINKPFFLQKVAIYLCIICLGNGYFNIGYTAQPLAFSCQVCFTPSQNCTEKIVQKIDRAEHTIYMQAYSFTAIPIVNALLRAKTRNVQVSIILDKSHLSRPQIARSLARNDIAVWIDSPSGIAHNKLIIIDKQLVITGSFNFSHAAQHKNRENVLFVKDETLASEYLSNWHQCQLSAKKFTIRSRATKTNTKQRAFVSSREMFLFVLTVSALGIIKAILK